jgi:hypothetical protein
MTGCVFLRLLEVKKQLNKFERYVQVDDQNGLTLKFLKPVLLIKDIAWLTRAKPTNQARSGRYVLWKYAFKKQSPKDSHETGDFAISQSMFFENGKLYKIKYPKRLSPILRREFVIGSLRSMGKGKVDQQRRNVLTAWDAKNAPETAKIPTRQDITRILGRPFSVKQSGSKDTFLYKYILDPNPVEKSKNQPILRMWFTFRHEHETLLTSKISFNGMTARIDFPESS